MKTGIRIVAAFIALSSVAGVSEAQARTACGCRPHSHVRYHYRPVARQHIVYRTRPVIRERVIVRSVPVSYSYARRYDRGYYGGGYNRGGYYNRRSDYNRGYDRPYYSRVYNRSYYGGYNRGYGYRGHHGHQCY
jgi:hypothetical protein